MKQVTTDVDWFQICNLTLDSHLGCLYHFLNTKMITLYSNYSLVTLYIKHN